jgi:hypothetical protein
LWSFLINSKMSILDSFGLQIPDEYTVFTTPDIQGVKGVARSMRDWQDI